MRKILIQAAHAAKQKNKTFYRSKYNKLKFRLGSANKAKVAIANKIARAVYKILAGDKYKEIGYAKADENKDKIDKLIKQLKFLGVDVKHENHQKIVCKKKITIDDTGVQLV